MAVLLVTYLNKFTCYILVFIFIFMLTIILCHITGGNSFLVVWLVSKVTYFLYYSKCLYLYLRLCVTSILIKSSFISPNWFYLVILSSRGISIPLLLLLTLLFDITMLHLHKLINLISWCGTTVWEVAGLRFLDSSFIS